METVAQRWIKGADFASGWMRKVPAARVARWVSIVLLLAIAWVLGRLVWAFMETPPQPQRWQPAAASVQSGNEGPAYQLSSIQNANLFGRYQQKVAPVVKKEPVKTAPKTKLNLTLVGVVASTDSSRALAVIANRGKQKTYGIDETIEGTRVTLQQVQTDRVIIRNNGRDEALMLEGIPYSEQAASTPAAADKPSVNNGAQAEDLAQIKEELIANPQSMLKYIRLSQVKDGNDIKGFRVNPGRDRRLFDQVGLKDNDLAVAVNGSDLRDPKAMSQLWQSLSDLTEINLTVEREGQLHEIYISF